MVGGGKGQGMLEVGNETRRRLTRESLSGQSRPMEAPVPAFGAVSQPPQSPAWVTPEREQKEEAVEVTLSQPVSGWQACFHFQKSPGVVGLCHPPPPLPTPTALALGSGDGEPQRQEQPGRRHHGQELGKSHCLGKPRESGLSPLPHPSCLANSFPAIKTHPI